MNQARLVHVVEIEILAKLNGTVTQQKTYKLNIESFPKVLVINLREFNSYNQPGVDFRLSVMCRPKKFTCILRQQLTLLL